MILAYGTTAILSLFLISLYVFMDKKRDIWPLLLFMSVAVCNLGYWMLALAPNLGAALVANRVAYFGSVFLPLLTLKMVLRLCNISVGRAVMPVLAAVGCVMLAITCSQGIGTLYYSYVNIEIVNGVTRLIREYGPLHNLYYIYLLGYMAAMIAISVSTIAKGKIRTRWHAFCLLCAVLCNLVVWFAEKFFPRGFEWLSVSYLVSECFILGLYRSMQRRGLLYSVDKTVSYQGSVVLTVFLLLFANFIRVSVGRTDSMRYIIAQILVLSIYLSILVAWGVSIHDRIIIRPIRRCLHLLVGLMMLWMLVRTLRHTVFFYVYPFGVWCWYAYYIAMVLIPLVCFYAAMYSGKPEGWRLPARYFLLCIPAAVLILGILTNDLHQLAFRFQDGFYENWDLYQRGVLYYAAVFWIFGCIVLMIGMMIRRCRIPATGKVIWPPIAVLMVGVLYSVLYMLDSDIFGFIEITAALCFAVVAIWESSIRNGLVGSNRYYEDLLKVSGMGVTVVDAGCAVRFTSQNAMPLTAEQIRRTEDGPIQLQDGIRVSGAPIRGGRVIWQEDVSGILALVERLTDIREDLRDSNEVSIRTYQAAKEVRQLAEKNRLHDELHRQTAHQLDRLGQWLDRLAETEDPAMRRHLLCRIVMMGSYLKRRNNLFFVNEQEGCIREEEFRLSVDEMVRNIRLTGIECAVSVQFGREIPYDAAMELLDFCAVVIERAYSGLSCLLGRFFFRDDAYYACLDAVCSRDLAFLAGGRVEISAEGDCYTLTMRCGGGEPV